MNKTKLVAFRAEPGQVRKLDALAALLNVTRSAVLHSLIETARIEETTVRKPVGNAFGQGSGDTATA